MDAGGPRFCEERPMEICLRISISAAIVSAFGCGEKVAAEGGETKVWATVAVDFATGKSGQVDFLLFRATPVEAVDGPDLVMPHACLPSRRQQAGRGESGCANNNGVSSGALIKTVKSRAQNRITSRVYTTGLRERSYKGWFRTGRFRAGPVHCVDLGLSS